KKRCRPPHSLFFFSSRRRHTRFSRNWSSDVCSSDLPEVMADYGGPIGRADSDEKFERYVAAQPDHGISRWAVETIDGAFLGYAEIGRASCREKVELEVAGVPLGQAARRRGTAHHRAL